jgi:hypothetical protein
VRIYDGNGNVLIADFTDPDESTPGYSTAKWRTAQFAVGALDLSKFNFTASGYLLISPERNGSETFQEKALTIYVDDVKMLPLTATAVKFLKETSELTAFYDRHSDRIIVTNLPGETYLVKLYDLMGRLMEEVQVSGDTALLKAGNTSAACFIVQAFTRKGQVQSIKIGK